MTWWLAPLNGVPLWLENPIISSSAALESVPAARACLSAGSPVRKCGTRENIEIDDFAETVVATHAYGRDCDDFTAGSST